jgi:molybdopterin/thiamine biosynthesis adenylyltransferase
MVQEPLRAPISVVIDERNYRRLFEHLFPGDSDEHGAILLAGFVSTPKGGRLLVRDVMLAEDGIDYVPGKRGYRALTAQFVAEAIGQAADEKLCYLAVHCHRGKDSVGFSADDYASHERGYPALLDINESRPVGALVFAQNAVAGEIWTRNGQQRLDSMRIVGRHIRNIYPNLCQRRQAQYSEYDRQTRLFGKVGQEILGDLRVGIIGLGGGGSLLNEWLSRLGIGCIVGVDFDRIDITNLPRVTGATRWDARSLLTASGIPWLQRIGKRFAAKKVRIARRIARRANPKIDFEAIDGDVLDNNVAMQLRDVDFLFLASDSIQSRLVFNALVKQYMIPGVQVGAKVSANKKTGEITEIFTATRLVLPGIGNGCLDCANCIPASLLQAEAISDGERQQQKYVDDPEVAEPSVITLNVLSAAQAANDLMMMFTGLFLDDATMLHQMNFARERRVEFVALNSNPRCPDCGDISYSRRSRGDSLRLPCRE